MKITIVNPTGETQEMEFEKLLKENKKTLLYFYPRDNTPGCTVEAMDFTGMKKEFSDQ